MGFSGHEAEGEEQMSVGLCVISCSVPDGLVMADSADYNNQNSLPFLSLCCFPAVTPSCFHRGANTRVCTGVRIIHSHGHL